MKPILRHKTFEKHFRSRIATNKKTVKHFEQRLGLFIEGTRDYPLNDHALIGKIKGLRAFSLGGDLRVVYLETDEYFEFLDIGSHSQVY